MNLSKLSTIDDSSRIAMIGPCRVGKTTTTRLLQGQYDLQRFSTDDLITVSNGSYILAPQEMKGNYINDVIKTKTNGILEVPFDALLYSDQDVRKWATHVVAFDTPYDMSKNGYIDFLKKLQKNHPDAWGGVPDLDEHRCSDVQDFFLKWLGMWHDINQDIKHLWVPTSDIVVTNGIERDCLHKTLSMQH